jgi:hypothetical protein
MIRQCEVTRMCAERGLQPMMWSDMLFALAPGSRGYYDVGSVVPEQVRRAVPRVDLVYWDYVRALICGMRAAPLTRRSTMSRKSFMRP